MHDIDFVYEVTEPAKKKAEEMGWSAAGCGNVSADIHRQVYKPKDRKNRYSGKLYIDFDVVEGVIKLDFWSGPEGSSADSTILKPLGNELTFYLSDPNYVEQVTTEIQKIIETVEEDLKCGSHKDPFLWLHYQSQKRRTTSN